MASKGLQSLTRSLSALRSLTASSKDPLTQCLTPRLSRSMATEASLPSDVLVGLDGMTLSSRHTGAAPVTEVLTTIYKFPTMEPLRFESYPSKHLHLPLRRDILHRAVVYEGDFTRQGTASTKTRHEIHGSHRKIRPQKGTGMARLGTRQSPMLKGGAKTFGPRPRDFATGLPKKMYDLAWRTALSYRYRKGELIICENGMEIDYPYKQRVKQIFNHNSWGREDGRTLVVTGGFRRNLFAAMQSAGELGRVQMLEDVDVKDLLELGRIVIEKGALDQLIREHSSDLTPKVNIVV